MLQIIINIIKPKVRLGAVAAFVSSLLTLSLVAPAFAATDVTIGNGPTQGGTYANAQTLANELVNTDVTISADTSITIADPIDLSSSGLGTPQHSLTLMARTCNVNNSINMAAQGNLILNCPYIYINGHITSGGSLIAPSRISGSSSNIFVLSPSADLQQAIDMSAQTSAGLVGVASGQYNENVTINHPLYLHGYDANGTSGGPISPTDPTINGTQPGGNVITVTANNVDIDYLHLDGSVNGGSSTPSVHGISARNVDGFGVAFSKFTGFSGTPIDTTGSTNVEQSNNSFEDQTVSFTSTAPTNASVGGPTYTPTANASSGLPVVITVDPSASSVCSISNGSVSFQTAGTCVLDANQAGNSNYNAAPQVQQSFTVNQAPAFTAKTPPLTATVGQPYSYTFTATGTPAPTYSLATGAPTWLSINPTTGSLTGTPPSGTTSFTYSVVATNSAGSATTGPFTVTVSPPPTTSTKADITTSLHCVSGARFLATGTCTVTVTNNGPATAKNVSVSATITEPLSFFLAGAIKTWNVPTLASGASASFTISAAEPIIRGTALVNASASSSNPDPNIWNNASSATF